MQNIEKHKQNSCFFSEFKQLLAGTCLLAIGLILTILQPTLAAERPNITFLPEPPEPPIIFAPRVTTEPVLDGKLDDPAWQQAVVIDRLTTRNGGTARTPTRVYMCYSRDAMFFAFDCAEPKIDDVMISAQKGEDKWPGDCVEVFFDRRRRKSVYYQFVTNTVDAKNDYGPGEGIKWNGDWTSKAGRDDDGWVTEIRIPFSNFGYKKAPTGGVWGMNVTRERVVRDPELTRIEEITTWALMGTFNAVSRYGILFFGSEEQYRNRVVSIQLDAAVDRHVQSTLNPISQIAVQYKRGTAKGSVLDLALSTKGGKPIGQWQYDEITSTRFSIDLPIKNLQPGEYELRLQAKDGSGRSSNEVALGFKLDEPKTQPRTKGRIAIRQTQAVPIGIDRWHVRTGVPFEPGALYDPATVRLRDGRGKDIPVQTRTLATWSKEGSIKWLSVDCQTAVAPQQHGQLWLHFGPDEKSVDADGITVSDSETQIVVDTKAARFAIRKQRFNLFDAMWVGDEQIVTPGDARGPYMVGSDGTVFRASADPDCEVIVEEQGPLMTIVRAAGAHRSGDQTLGRYVVRMYFYANLPYVRVQHTFIIAEDTTKTTYRDIGLTFPFAGSRARFGLPNSTASETHTHGQFTSTVTADSISLLQRRWDDFIVMQNSDSPNVLVQSDKAPGWFGRDKVAVLVKDFWQNFPKELQADRDGLTVHLWPAHGQTVMSPEETASVEQGWRLMFAHQGEQLNFNMPNEYFEGPLTKEYGFAYYRNGKYQLAYGAGAKKANAMGLGKTHDMLLVFGDAAETDKLTALNRAFQAGVHFLPDPNYLCATGAAGWMQPQDKETFPIEEDRMSSGFDYLMRTTLDLNEAYGMFNYGDSFTSIKLHTKNQEPFYYRLWAGYHHGRARTPWLLYMRSGDPKYLKWANANTTHLADVDTCHWTTPYFASHPSTSAMKLIGGMHDYKGIVHWHTGSRTGEYNSQMDFLMYGYYLTGNRRLWDVLLEAGPLAVERGRPAPERHGAGCLSAQIHYYQATWDPRALLKIVEGLPVMYSKPAWEHAPSSIDWAPYIEPWIEMTSDPAAIAHVMEFADWNVSDPLTRPKGGTGQGNIMRAMSLAYRLTGDRKYLIKSKSFSGVGPKLYQSAGDNYSGCVNWYPWSYYTQQAPYLLRDIKAIGTIKNPLQTLPYWQSSSGPGTMYHHRTPDQLNHMVVVLKEDKDQSFKVGTRFGAYVDVNYQLIKPDGSVGKSGVIERKEIVKVGDHYRFEFEYPKDGQTGEYRLVMTSQKAFRFWYAQVSSLKTERFELPDPSTYQPHLVGSGRWYFRVPADCEFFRIKLGSHRDQRRRSVMTVFTPDDLPAGSLSMPYGSKPKWITIEPKRADRGKVWAVALRLGVLLDVEGIDRSFAALPQGAVDPQ